MRRIRIEGVVLVCLTSLVAAQEFSEVMAAAQVEIDGKDWDAALVRLLELLEKVPSDVERAQLATHLEAVGEGLRERGSPAAALRAHEAALAVRRQLHGDRDHPDVAKSLSGVAYCLAGMGRAREALQQFEATLAMVTRVHGGEDHQEVADTLSNIASCQQLLGRLREALPQHEAALAMNRRLHAGGDHPSIVTGMLCVANSVQSLGRTEEALQQYEAALAMLARLYGTADHPLVAACQGYVVTCLLSLGRAEEALTRGEATLAMQRRLCGERDHPDMAASLTNLSACLKAFGRPREALLQAEAALAMNLRLYGDRDHPEVATSLNNVATCYYLLGNWSEQLLRLEAASAMLKRLYRGDHPKVAAILTNLGDSLKSVGRPAAGLVPLEEAASMQQRLLAGRDHPATAGTLNSLGNCLTALGRWSEGLSQHEAVLAMRKRLYKDTDHPDLAASLNNVALCLEHFGRLDEALQNYEASLAMCRRLYGDRAHHHLAVSMNRVGSCLLNLGRTSEALELFKASVAMWKRLYADADHPQVANSLGNVSLCLQALDRTEEALAASEEAAVMVEGLRETSRTSADLRQSLFDELKSGGVFERMQACAAKLGKPADSLHAAERGRGRELLDLLEQQQVDVVEEAIQRARHRGKPDTAARLNTLRQQLDEVDLENDRILRQLTQLEVPGENSTGRKPLFDRSKEIANRRRQILDERASLLGDEVPVGRVRTSPEIRAVLHKGEVLLEFTITADVGLLHVLASEGDVEVIPLPKAHAALERLLPLALRRASRSQVTEARGRDPDASAVGDAAAAADSAAHQLFAALIPGDLWSRLQSAGCVFVAAHRALHRLPFEMLVTEINDGKPVYWIDHGPLVAYVPSGSALHWLRKRAAGQSAVAADLDLLAVGDPGAEMASSNSAVSEIEKIRRAGDLERLRQLPPLRGATAEVTTITSAWTKVDRQARSLLGVAATERAVLELAAKAKYLHFACHGIAEEYAGQSLSMLVLSQPQNVLPEDDGLLKLGDLLNRWRGRLASCRLVVLSACRTNVGPTLRDEAPQALPIGFLFAGAPSVVSSLWAVDDASTSELMTDFYGRLLAGETDKLKAFTEAKKALRAKYPDPFHWAPFLYMGSPE